VRIVARAAFFLVLVGSGCGNGNGSEATWDGPPDPGVDGTVAVDGFNAYLEDVEEPWEGSPATTAAHFLRLDERTVSRTTIEESTTGEGSGPTQVVVTLDGLFDDSVRAERWTFELTPGNETFTLTSARRDLQCQPDRGHQDFAPEPCV
jgi:hypothetical protein